MSKRTRRTLLILSSGLAVILGGCYYLFVDRRDIHVENAGWVLDFSHIRVACPVCTGRVERLTANGQPVPLPVIPEYAQNDSIVLITPVAWFRHHRGERSYRWYAEVASERIEIGEPVTSEELARGYYDHEVAQGSDLYACRPGTPKLWCRMVFGDSESRWLDPRLIDKLDWTTLASQPTTGPSLLPDFGPTTAPLATP